MGQRERGRKPLGGRHEGQGREFNFPNGHNFNHYSYQYHNNNSKTHKHQVAQNTSNIDTKKNEQVIIVCQICFKRGHNAAECWDRYEYDRDEVPQAFTMINHHNTTSDQSIYVDLGATSHMVNNPGNLDTITSYKGHDKIIVGNCQGLNIFHVGNISLNTNHGTLKLKDVLVIPQWKKNLLFVAQLTNDFPCSLKFNADGITIKNAKNQILARGKQACEFICPW